MIRRSRDMTFVTQSPLNKNFQNFKMNDAIKRELDRISPNVIYQQKNRIS